ncbi:UNVERIFIED_CONTAM: hypothetical protein FKN15_057501 [Acipenser sinensis]
MGIASAKTRGCSPKIIMRPPATEHKGEVELLLPPSWPGAPLPNSPPEGPDLPLSLPFILQEGPELSLPGGAEPPLSWGMEPLLLRGLEPSPPEGPLQPLPPDEMLLPCPALSRTTESASPAVVSSASPGSITSPPIHD